MNRVARLGSRQLIALDGLAAIAYLALLMPGAVIGSGVPARVAVPLMLLVGAPVAVRRRWPTPVFLLVLAASVTALAAGVLTDPLLAAAFALYPVALCARRPRLPAGLTGGVAITIIVLGSVAGTPTGTWPRAGTAVLGVGFLAGAWTAGQGVQERRAEAVRAAAELADRAVAEERLRIARELHDVVAHSMSIIAVQAGTANHVIAVRPEQAQAALRVIESTSRAALTEMRQLLGVLRSGAEAAEFAPLPGPSGLPTLIRRAEEAGVEVKLDLRGTESLPGGIALSVYRIAQEALTNVVRHAAPTRCEISVTVEAREIRIDVTDDGRARASPPARAAHDATDRARPQGPRRRQAEQSGTDPSPPHTPPAAGAGPGAAEPTQLNTPPPGSAGPGSAGPRGAGPRGAGPGSAWPDGAGSGSAWPDGAGPGSAWPDGAGPGSASPDGAEPRSAWPGGAGPENAWTGGAGPSRPRTLSSARGGRDAAGGNRARSSDDGGRVGHGLIGMRERVLMYGGSFTAGPRAEGGFAVSARIPYEP